ncbi:MAG TPA: hypothetical protein VK213_07225 [Bacteroidales bacterium]|nr:hypothetical protein [Bacteroidales bacterium]
MKSRFFISILLILGIPCNGMMQDNVAQQDTAKISFEFNLRMVPEIMKYAKRYRIISTVNNDYSSVELNHEMQRKLSESTYTDSSLISSSYFLSQSIKGDIPEKNLFYGAWRDQLTKSSSEEEIKNSVTSGTNGLIELGYSDFKNDFLPFITMLMEENHLVTYDFSRTKGVGSGSRGIVPSTRLLNALRSMDPAVKAGVCRDVHETGRELLKTMSEVYYDHFYPGSDIDFDEFIFLQSWTTDASQHVTLSLIDPFDRSKVYELDWGRVLEETGIQGYNNGRMYGNTFRIWQFDKRRMRTVPVDFRRTQFGRILDFAALTNEEYTRFNGTDDEKSYSDLSLKYKTVKSGTFSLSAGMFHPYQKYLLSGWRLNTSNKNIGRIFSHSFTFGLQAAIGEDTRKKQYLYPEKEWQFTSSLMGIPRIISEFRTPEARIGRNFTLDVFMYQQFDVFLIVNSFTDKINGHDFSRSGDANLSFSNGLNVNYTSDGELSGVFTLQARSCLLPGDIRLLTPNAMDLFPHVKFITPAVDAITTITYNLPGVIFKMNSVVEFTSLNSILYSGDIRVLKDLKQGVSLSITAGSSGILSGMQYYWYPPSNGRIDLQLLYKRSSVSAAIYNYQGSKPTAGVSFTRYLY